MTHLDSLAFSPSAGCLKSAAFTEPNGAGNGAVGRTRDHRLGVPGREMHSAPASLIELGRFLFGMPALRVWLTEEQPWDGAERGAEVLPFLADAPGADVPDPSREATALPLPFRAKVAVRTPEGRLCGALVVTSPEARPPGPSEEDHRRLEVMARVAADVLNLQQRVRQLDEALLERTLLAREADHRVANSLQLVQGALTFQAIATSDVGAKEALRGAARRVTAVAEAHHHLHGAVAPAARTEADAASDAAAYLDALVQKLASSAMRDGSAGDGAVVLRATPGKGTVPASLLPRLGLIAAELVTNALKHGSGRVLVELSPAPDGECGALLAVSDEGEGFPADFDLQAGSRGGLGMRLLVALARPGRVWVDPVDRRRILVRLGAKALTGLN